MKKGIRYLTIVLLVSLLASGVPFHLVYATGIENSGENGNSAGDTGSNKNTEDYNDGNGSESSEDTTETIPESYYLPIESNNVEGWPKGDAIEADAAVVMDASTGTFLYSKNMTAKEYPASITKIMTTLLALEHGNLDDVITFSENAVYSIEPGSTHLGIKAGEQLTLRQALYGIMLASANEISNGVAEHIAGSVENFAQMMNDKAAELGCVNTHFVNPHGLHDENHYTCARDMALIMQAALKNKMFCKIIDTVEYSYPKTNITDEERYFMNHHKMLYEDGYCYTGCLGGKTGFTDDALNTLVTYVKRDKEKLISVVLRTNGAEKAYQESKQILDYAFNNFTKEKLDLSRERESAAQLLGINYVGNAVINQDESLGKPAFQVSKNISLNLPKGADVKQVIRKYDFKAKKLEFFYHGWPVGKTKIQVEPVFVKEEKGPQYRTETEKQESQSGQEESGQAEDGNTDRKAANMLDRISHVFISTWQKLDMFIKDNTVESAVLGGILLVIFVPLLVIAITRNHRYKKILKERMKEEEIRKQLEEEIQRKTPQEIEAELRAEQEAEWRSEQRAEERRIAAERAARELDAAERLLEEQRSQGETGNMVDTGTHLKEEE